VLAALLGIRAGRVAGSRLDRLNLLLLMQIGIFAVSALYLVVPGSSVWRWGAMLLLAAFLPLLGIGLVRMSGNRFNEISLALLLQVGALGYFLANSGLPSAFWSTSSPAPVQLAALSPSTSPPAKKQPAKMEVAKAKAAQNPPAVKAEPAKVPPANNVPAAKVEPGKVSPVAKVEPAKALPANVAPGKNRPAVKTQPAKAAATKNLLAANPPAKTQPGKKQPVRMPSNRSPVPKPPPPAFSAIPWTELGGTGVPLVALVSLFGVRVRRMTERRLDGLGLLLLSQIGLLAIMVLNRLVPGFGVWQGEVVLLLITLILLSCVYFVRMTESKVNEVSLAVFVQIGLLALYIASWWLPYLWTRVIAGALLMATLPPFLFVRVARTKESGLSEIDLVLLAQLGLFAFLVADRWLPSPWAWVAKGAIVLAVLAAVFWPHRKGLVEGRSKEVLLLLAVIGILLVVVFGFLFPVTSWSLM
jgi:hypothetical protein